MYSKGDNPLMKGNDFMNNYLVEVCFQPFCGGYLRRKYEIAAEDKSTAIQLAYNFLGNIAMKRFQTIDGKYSCIFCLEL